MAWIDIFLADGDPHKVYGADAEKALTGMMKIRHIPFMWKVYRKSGFNIKHTITFMFFDVIRNVAYRKGFKDGKDFEWNGKSKINK